MSRGSITAIIARVNCRQCYTAECVCESLSLVYQDFNSSTRSVQKVCGLALLWY